MKILILASNPRKDLNLDREIRDLKDVIKKSHNRQQFEVEDALAVRVGDLQELFFRHRPQIVHFCGHGSGEQGLVFEGNDGGEQWVRAAALSDLFRLFSENVGCVLLNACYSEEQASAIVDHIDYVIGMNQEIRDDAAIAFSKGFYRALGYARSIEEAYEFGKNAIQLEISGSSKVLRSATEQHRKLEVVDSATKQEIPEHLKPILKRNFRLSQNPDRVISGSQQPLSQAQREEIQLDVAEALTEKVPNQKGDANLQQYREKVREFLADRRLTPGEKFELKQFAREIGVSEPLQAEILQQEENKIEAAKEQYKELVSEYVKDGYYPFDDETQDELKKLQDSLGLLDSEVVAISQPILKTAEQERLEKLRQRYEQEFRKAIEVQYPINSSTRGGLRALQQSLKLSDEAVANIEQPIIIPKESEYRQRLEAERRKQESIERQRQREYEDNLKQYEQEFSKELKAKYPIEGPDRNRLRDIQQSLGLSDGDVIRIEHKLLEKTTYEEIQTRRIIDLLAERFRQSEGIDLRRDKHALQRLTEAAEKAMFELSMPNVSQTEISLPFITATEEGPKHLDTTLTREELEKLTSIVHESLAEGEPTSQKLGILDAMRLMGSVGRGLYDVWRLTK